MGEALRGSPDAGNPDVVAVREACVRALGDKRVGSAEREASALGHAEALGRLGEVVGVTDELHPFRVVAPRS